MSFKITYHIVNVYFKFAHSGRSREARSDCFPLDSERSRESP